MKNLCQVLLALCFLLSSLSRADAPVVEVEIADDGWVEVPLDFTFPFYGNSYVTSFMFSNGVVGFLDPLTVDGTGYIHDGLCCDGQDFSSGATGVRFHYTIMPWHTDLIDAGAGKFYTQGDDTYQKYMWENIVEYYDTSKENSFDLTIFPLGNIEVNYTELSISNHSVTVGVVGDLSAGEYEQWFYNHPTSGAVFWNSQQDNPVEIENGQSICSVVPDSHISCLYYPDTYADAYYEEQCSIDSLYDYGCSGFDEAYYEEYVEEDEPEVWVEQVEIYVAPEPPVFIEIDIPEIPFEVMIAEIEALIPEFELEIQMTQQEFEAELEAELEEFFEPVLIEEIENDVPEEESTEEESNETQEEVLEDEPLEEEEPEESTEEQPVELAEKQEEIKIVQPKENKLLQIKKKASKKNKMREIITNKLKNLAIEIGEAVTLEEQQKLQGLLIALLNFNSGFNSYNSSLVDAIFYKDKGIYLDKDIPDNQRGLRNGLANEILHNKLVDLQWQ